MLPEIQELIRFEAFTNNKCTKIFFWVTDPAKVELPFNASKTSFVSIIRVDFIQFVSYVTSKFLGHTGLY